MGGIFTPQIHEAAITWERAGQVHRQEKNISDEPWLTDLTGLGIAIGLF